MAKAQYPIDGKLGKQYKVTSDFGWRTHPIEKIKKHHNGVDLWGAAEPLYIESWHDGVVIAAGTSKQRLSNGAVGGVGWYVDVRSKINGKFYVSRYAHMVPKSLKVKKGQKVEAGTVLGKMGTSGASTGKHLHFEIVAGKKHVWDLKGKGFVDPLKFIKSIIEQQKLIADAPKATPEDAPVAPAPVHGNVPAAPKKESVPSNSLKIKSTGEDVKYLQKALKLKADGQFGPITQNAVKKFQKENKLPETGEVDIKTWELLLSKKPAPARTPAPDAPTASSKSATDLHPALANKSVTPGTVEAVMAVAKYYVDKKYVEGPKKNTVFGKFMGLNYAPWCASFVSYVFNKAGAGDIVRKTQTKNGFVGCTAGINGLKKKGYKTVKLAEAKAGDIIFFDWQDDNDPDHVGIVVKSNPKKKIVTCYEGNTTNGKGGSQSNGGGVFKRDRRYAQVHVVIRPVFKVTSAPKVAPTSTKAKPTA
jgi:peptidoglycan hydrolase-like protein with peptidoglycan-binding domain